MEFIKETIAKAGPQGVCMFAKSYCPHCKRAQKALLDVGVHPVVVDLDLRDDGADIQDKLEDFTGQRSVPNVFYAGEHLGGADDTVAAVAAGKFEGLDAS